MLIVKVKLGKSLITCDSCKVTATTPTFSAFRSFVGNSFTYTNSTTNSIIYNSGTIHYVELP